MQDNDPKHTSKILNIKQCQLVEDATRMTRPESHRELVARAEGVP